jgi:hypothetical protein
MAVSGISSSSVNSYQPSRQDSFRQQFLQLAKSLNSGDLAGAQQAYTSLTQAQGSTQIDPNSPFGQALTQIGKSLQSGDITGAQQALSALKQQGAQGAHHHHHHKASSSSSCSTSNSSSSSTNTSEADALFAPTTGTSVNVTA